jgi:hypothetical protein
MFTLSFTQGVNTLYYSEEWRGKQRISPPGDNFTPIQGTKFTPGDNIQLTKMISALKNVFFKI